MNKLNLISFIAAAALIFSAGCTSQQQAKTVEQICIPRIDKAEAMKTAENVLGQFNFNIEKSDTETGFIKTRPLAGAHFFEFWRKDSVGAFNWAQANLHSIRRTARINIAPQNGKLCIDCTVNTQKLSIPEHPITGSQAYAMFSASGPSRQKLKLHPDQQKAMTWTDLGQDSLLAAEIIKRIQKQIASPRKENAL